MSAVGGVRYLPPSMPLMFVQCMATLGGLLCGMINVGHGSQCGL